MRILSRALASAYDALRRPVLRRRVGKLVLEEVEGLDFVVLPEVFNPRLFRTSGLLVRALDAALETFGESTDGEPRVLDLGTGSGLGAVFAAWRGARVVAVDLNPEAVRCARINALLHRLEERVEARRGDLFAPVAGERFDLVLFNPPYFRGEPSSRLDAAWRATDVLERFAAGLRAVLVPGGRALVVLSSHGYCDALLEGFSSAGLAAETALSHDFGNEVITVHAVSAAREVTERPGGTLSQEREGVALATARA